MGPPVSLCPDRSLCPPVCVLLPPGGIRQGQEATTPPTVDVLCVLCLGASLGLRGWMPQSPFPRVVSGVELCLPGHVHARAVGGDNGTLLAGGRTVSMELSWRLGTEWGLSGQTASPYSAFMPMTQRYPLAQHSSPVSVVWQADGNLV